VVSAAWEEFDRVNGWWTIPAEKSKNKLPHRVPLSPLALEVLDQARKVCGESRYPFPSPRGDQPMAQIALGHALRKNLAVLGAGDFTPHDLRRTAASHMTGMGISRLVVSKILNHVERGITAVYDRHSYDAEKRQALEAWARKLEAIITGQARNNVVALSAARST
jgi:integrase